MLNIVNVRFSGNDAFFAFKELGDEADYLHEVNVTGIQYEELPSLEGPEPLLKEWDGNCVTLPFDAKDRTDTILSSSKSVLLHIPNYLEREMMIMIFNAWCEYKNYPAEMSAVRHPRYPLLIVDYGVILANHEAISNITASILIAIHERTTKEDVEEAEVEEAEEQEEEDQEHIEYTMDVESKESEEFTDEEFDVGDVVEDD